MNKLARFVIRPAGNDSNSPGDLILGALYRTQNRNLLRPGVVYEIREVLGTLTIVPVGDAAIGYNARDTLIPGVHWLGTPDQILGDSGGRFILTREELTRG